MTRIKWRRVAPLVAVLSLGLLLRLIALRTRGLWYDDAFSIFLARQDVARIVAGTAADTMPPLYYFLLRLWMGLGSDLVTLRLLNVLVSLAIVALTYRVADVIFNPRTAVWAALFAAVSPFQIYHAQELRMYALLCVNLLLYLYFFARIYLDLDDRAWLSWVGLVASGALAMYSHNLAVFTLLSANLLLLLERRWRLLEVCRRGVPESRLQPVLPEIAAFSPAKASTPVPRGGLSDKLLACLILAQAAIVVLTSPWLVMVPGQVAKIQRAFWTPRPGLLELVQALITFHTNLPVPRWMIPIAVTATVLCLALVTCELVRRWRRDLGVQLLATFALFPALLTFAASYLMRPLFVPRGLILSAIVYYVLAARVVAAQRGRLARAVLLLAFIVPALMALPAQYTFDEFPRSPYQPAVEFLCVHVRPGDVVLHDNKLSYFPMHYYGPDLPQVFLPDEPGSHNDTLARVSQDAMSIWPAENLDAATAGAERVWLVVFKRARAEYEAQGWTEHPVIDRLAAERRETEVHVFRDLQILLFQ